MTLPNDVPVEQQPGGPAQTPGQPALPTSVVDWEARYKGTQPVLQTQATRITELTGELGTKDGLIAQLNAQLAQRAQEVEAKASDAAARAAEVAAEKKRADALAEDLLRAKTLLKPEFQSLAAFEEAKVLPAIPNATEEMLVNAFTTFKNALSQVKQEGVKEAIGGVTPPAPPTSPGNTTPSKEELTNQAFAASKRKDFAEYDRIMAELYKLG